MTNYKKKLHPIKAFLFDFDGVMTDGSVWTLYNGDTIRAGNIKDGYALQYAVKQGYYVGIISGATSLSITNRMKALQATHIYTGCANKIETFNTFLNETRLKKEETLYMGDDIPDYEIMKAAGIATCPADAAQEIKEISDYISLYAGGKGCVRDIIEQTLRLHGKWFKTDAMIW